ncbi:MAG TPA: APC family permease [Candidatus Kapabacteria bacterium]
MKITALIILNIGLVVLFFWILRRKNILSIFDNGRWWLTWLSVAIITLMDELTSIFYVPAESFAIVGVSAFVFIMATSVLMRFLSNRMVEIAHILEHHGIKGGGVYSFSYLVMGPKASFVAVASILVTYILTAAISTVAAVNNGGSLFSINPIVGYIFMFAIIWAVAGLNIIGIKENARFTFFIFVAAALVLLTMLASAFMDPSPGQGEQIMAGFSYTWDNITSGFVPGIGFLIFGLASVILAYSGIESVIQTAGLVKSWKEIKKAYFFLAITVGIFTPLLTMMVLTRTDISFHDHELDLITHFATVLNGHWFGILVGALASFTLIMAVNTAFVASSELLERVAHRYGFHWLIKTNRRDSLYRIHIINAIFFTAVIAATAGSQSALAHMYAVGLVASFTINMGALVWYRYQHGSSDIKEYFTSRTGTVVIFVILLACFIYIAINRIDGFSLWLGAVVIALIIGLRVAKGRAPEKIEYAKLDLDQQTDLALQIAETEKDFHIYMRRPKDISEIRTGTNIAYVTLFSPRAGAPDKLAPNHYRFPFVNESLFDKLVELIEYVDYEIPDKNITFHLGWPTSSWIDRMSIGVMVLSLLRLPKRFPNHNFVIEYFRGELKPVIKEKK